jgi:hypothetical protein
MKLRKEEGMTDEPREETRTDEEQDVEAHRALRDAEEQDRLQADEAGDEDVEGHFRPRGKTLRA